MKVAQSGLTLCNPMDYIGHGILQARILEWVEGRARGEREADCLCSVSFIKLF